MRDIQLQFSPFSFIAIREVVIRKQVNEHNTAYIRGIIHQSNYRKYLDLSMKDNHLPFSVTAVDSEGGEIIVFQGVTTHLEIRQEGYVAIMTVEAKSGSYLMDINERFRTFQDTAVTNSEVLDILGETYADYNFILKTQDANLGQFTVQYFETDWAFAKRLASRLNTFLVPADTRPGTRFYFGAPHFAGITLDDDIDYEVFMDYKATDEKKRQGLEEANEADAFWYVIEQRDIYALGDMVKFQEMELYIDKITTTFLGQQLVHRYYLRHKNGLRTAKQYNERLIGASLDGQVLNVRRDEVQVRIAGDENANQSVSQWFPFATVYSSPDGTGWFCMPERGDQIRLYMPDREEKHAVVFNALHIESEVRSNPDIKSMRTKHGKEIRFTPNTIVMTNNTGMEVSIIDGEGVRIDSNKNIFIKAEGNIDITGGTNVSMLAGDSIIAQQGGTSLEIDDNIAFVGGKLRMQ